MRCSNCGGFYLEDRCNMPNKVIPLQPSSSNYQQQACDNLRNARNTDPRVPTDPPNLYYDQQNYQQTDKPLAMVQNLLSVVNLPNTQSSQDARFMDASPHHIKMIEITNVEDTKSHRALPSLVVTRGGAQTNPIDSIAERNEKVAISHEESNDSPHL